MEARLGDPSIVATPSQTFADMSERGSLPLRYGCNCGAVRFEVSGPLLDAVYCHCTRCQRRTDTAVAASAGVKPGTFRTVSGETQVRRWNARDGNDKAFCGTCCSARFSPNPESPEVIFVRMESSDDDRGASRRTGTRSQRGRVGADSNDGLRTSPGVSTAVAARTEDQPAKPLCCAAALSPLRPDGEAAALRMGPPDAEAGRSPAPGSRTP